MCILWPFGFLRRSYEPFGMYCEAMSRFRTLWLDIGRAGVQLWIFDGYRRKGIKLGFGA